MNNNQEIHLNLNNTVDDDDDSDNHSIISVSISLPSSTEQLSTVCDSSDTESTYPEFSSDEWDDIEKECEYMAEQYLEDNALHMSSKQFFDNMALSVFDYMYSTGLDQQWCKHSETGLVKPDCLMYMEISEDAAKKRGGFGEERYETTEMQKNVREVFADLREDWWNVVDADRTIEEVQKDVQTIAKDAVERCKRGKELEHFEPGW